MVGICGILFVLISSITWKIMAYFLKESLKIMQECIWSGEFKFAPIQLLEEYIPALTCMTGRPFLNRCLSKWSKVGNGAKHITSPIYQAALIHKKIVQQKKKIQIQISSIVQFKESKQHNAKKGKSLNKNHNKIEVPLNFSHNLLPSQHQYFHSHPFTTLT